MPFDGDYDDLSERWSDRDDWLADRWADIGEPGQDPYDDPTFQEMLSDFGAIREELAAFGQTEHLSDLVEAFKEKWSEELGDMDINDRDFEYLIGYHE